MHFLHKVGRMGAVLDNFVNGYPTWLKTPLCNDNDNGNDNDNDNKNDND